MNNSLKALVVSSNLRHAYSLFCALSNAQFKVDLVTTNKTFNKSKLLDNVTFFLRDDAMINFLSLLNLDEYDLVQICDEHLLKEVSHSNMSIKQKQRLLAVMSEKNISHICSKIELSKILSQNNIKTPPFIIAQNKLEAKQCAAQLTFPVFIKIDYSSGGTGTFECGNENDIASLDEDIFSLPVLVQKKIDGELIDLSCFHQQTKLIHFDYCEFLETVSDFGPSLTRKYWQPYKIKKEVFESLRKIGEVMGLNGFSNISGIRKGDEIYFMEADARPNIWIGFSKYIGNDISVKIEKWFKNNEFYDEFSLEKDKNFPDEKIIPHFFRLKIRDILCNKYNVWKYLPRQDLALLFAIYYEEYELKKNLKILRKNLRKFCKNLFTLRVFSR